MDQESKETIIDEADVLTRIEQTTPSGRPYTKTRWTLGSSTDLVEGQPKESALVAAAWIVVPTAVALLFLALMVG